MNRICHSVISHREPVKKISSSLRGGLLASVKERVAPVASRALSSSSFTSRFFRHGGKFPKQNKINPICPSKKLTPIGDVSRHVAAEILKRFNSFYLSQQTEDNIFQRSFFIESIASIFVKNKQKKDAYFYQEPFYEVFQAEGRSPILADVTEDLERILNSYFGPYSDSEFDESILISVKDCRSEGKGLVIKSEYDDPGISEDLDAMLFLVKFKRSGGAMVHVELHNFPPCPRK